jgi:hypothetical protein
MSHCYIMSGLCSRWPRVGCTGPGGARATSAPAPVHRLHCALSMSLHAFSGSTGKIRPVQAVRTTDTPKQRQVQSLGTACRRWDTKGTFLHGIASSHIQHSCCTKSGLWEHHTMNELKTFAETRQDSGAWAAGCRRCSPRCPRAEQRGGSARQPRRWWQARDREVRRQGRCHERPPRCDQRRPLRGTPHSSGARRQGVTADDKGRASTQGRKTRATYA